MEKILDILAGPAVSENISGFYMTDYVMVHRIHQAKIESMPHLVSVCELVNFKLIKLLLSVVSFFSTILLS